jgi:RHS repeat-associated protein
MSNCKIIISIILAIQIFVQPIAVLANVKTVIDPKGQVATMDYDALDRLDLATYSGGAGTISEDYKYDAEDNLFEVVESRNGNQRTYKREYDVRDRLKNTTDAFGKVVRFEYDNANNLKTLTDATNKVTTYEYDAKNQLDTVVQNGNTIANYDWLKDGLLDKVTYSQNSTSRVYTYDNADRVKTITNSFTNSQSESFEYVYDANSNRDLEIKKVNGQALKTVDYDYDKLDRLTKADYTNNAGPNPPNNQQATYVENTELNSYQYDAVGNRINEKVKTQTKNVTLTTNANGVTTRSEGTPTFSPELDTTATFDDLNQLKQLNEPNGISSFKYDDNGNLTKISKLVSGQTNTINEYEYDIRNQLTVAKDGQNITLASFDYDFERKRTSKISAGNTTNYTYAGSQVVNETNNNSASASYTIGAGEIVKSEFGASESNFHYTDALGSVTSVVNTVNGSLTRSEYNAFGEQTGGTGSSNSIGYTGQRLDNETGLMALGNGERYYSPSYARFIQQDSFSGKPMSPQSMNRFAYGLNNPNKFTDPSGNHPAVLIPAIIGGVVGGALGASYSYEMQMAQIADGTMRADQFSWWQVAKDGAKGAVIGAVAGALATLAIAASPIALPLIIAAGVLTSGSQIIKGHYDIQAGYKNAGAVDEKYGVIGVVLSVLGGIGGRGGTKGGGKPTVLEENITPTSGAKEIPLVPELPSQAPKQLGGGKMQETIDSGRLLKAAPEEVVNAPKETRFIGDESGNVKDLSTGRGNQNTVGKQGPIETPTTIENVRVGVKEVLQENLSQIKEIAPDAKVGYRGSLARGTKHQGKGGGDFEPTNFDVDAFVVSNKLASQVKPNKLGQRWGNKLGIFENIHKTINQQLKSLFPGLRNSKKNDEFQFRIFTEEQMNKWNQETNPHTIIEEDLK